MLRFSKIIAAVLVLLALVLAAYAWKLSRQPAPRPAPANAHRQAPVPTFPVVVTTKPLPAGEPIPADALRLAELPINPSGAFKTVAAATGRIPVLDLSEGTPLLDGQMASGLALRLGPGERAVAVKADEVMGVGNNVRPGDYVDVFFTVKVDHKDVDRSQARLLLARKRVLAYGQASLEALPDEAGAEEAEAKGRSLTTPTRKSTERTPPARTVVLAVPVEDVNRLTLGEASGRLVLALRHPTDTREPDPTLFAELPPALQPLPAQRGAPARAPLTGVDRAQAGLATIDLVAGGPAPARQTRTAARSSDAPRARPAGTEVEILRGDRRDTVRY